VMFLFIASLSKHFRRERREKTDIEYDVFRSSFHMTHRSTEVIELVICYDVSIIITS
jgi:hypothetical protein